MIVCGDFVFPFKCISDVGLSAPDEFIETSKLINFEGSLLYSNDLVSNAPIPLYSSLASFGFLEKIGASCLTLANNHTFDFNIEYTKVQDLTPKTLNLVGAGLNKKEACIPVKLNGYTIFNFGWETIGVKGAKANVAGCASLNRKYILDKIATYRESFPEEKILIIFHWNYEFELYPLPVDRELARTLSDIGVYAIVGHHSHIIQGFEYFGDMPVFYGVGNFFMPKYQFGNYTLDYPESAKVGVCIDISSRESVKVYTAENVNNDLIVSGPFSLDEKGHLFSNEFSGKSAQEYVSFFSKNRKKSFLLPIYTRIGLQEVFYDFFVALRQKFIDFLVKSKLK